MGKDAGSAPTTPDYGQSVGNGVDTDLASLNRRRSVDTAAQTGGYVADGKKVTKDEYDQGRAFNQKKYDDAVAAGDTYTANEAQAALKNSFDFTGTGAVDVANDQNEQAAQGYIDLVKKFGPQYAEQYRNLQQQMDPEAFALSEQLGGSLADGSRNTESLYNGINGPSYERVKDSNLPSLDKLSQTDLAQLGKVAGGTNLQDTGAASAGRADLERQVFDEQAKNNSGALDPVLQRAAEQASRARGAAVGNTLGDSSALSEALDVQLAQQARGDKTRSNALALLQSGQTTSDKGNTLSQQNFDNSIAGTGFNNAAEQQGYENKGNLAQFNNNVGQTTFSNIMTALGQRNQASQNQFSDSMSLAGAKAGARQNDTNAQLSYLGLSPVGGGGGGGGSGASPFGNATPQSYGISVDGAAGDKGAQWAGQLYGAQTGQYAGAKGAASSGNGAAVGAGGAIAAAAIIAI